MCGGVRVIYFYQHMDTPPYLLMVYAKARREVYRPTKSGPRAS
jgi:hypothetical protein